MFNHNKLPLRCCNNCQSSSGEFKEAVNLKKSCLKIYIHEDKSKKIIGDDDRRSIILYNTGDRELKRFDYVVELCRYKTKCLRCMAIIQRVSNLLEDINFIRKHQILGICEFCKRSNVRNKCKRCEYIVNKFINNKVQESKDYEERFMKWLLKIQKVLISIMRQGQVICKHKFNILLDYESKMQLDNVLQHLKSSLPVKQPNIEVYPDRICLESSDNDIIKNKQILDELLLKLKADNKIGINIEQILSDSVSESESSCICKQLNKNKSQANLTPLFETLSNDFTQTTKLSDKHKDYKGELLTLPHIKENEKQGEKSKKIYKTDDQSNKTKQMEKKDEVIRRKKKYIAHNDIENSKNKDIKQQQKYMSIDQIRKKQISTQPQHLLTNNIEILKKDIKKQDSFYQLMLKLIKEKNKEKILKEKSRKQEKNIKMPVIGDLPNIKTTIKPKVDREDSGSTIECNDIPDKVTEMIIGSKIVRYDSHHKDNSEMKTPLLKIFADCTTPIIESNKSFLEDDTNPKEQDDAGVIYYKLSDRKFIENGWTQLPATKIMRRMNIYKMITCNNEYDWFKSHEEQKTLFYDSGGMFAEVSENGSGKWFYENGDIALDYYNVTARCKCILCLEYYVTALLVYSQVVSKFNCGSRGRGRDLDVTSGKRYIIYSSSEDNNINNKKKQTTILGCFDSFGNGVVYDHCGNARLKYNQSEGLVIDKVVGPPGRWKWHALNEPPVIQTVYLDTKVTVDPSLKDDDTRKPNMEMIAIEHEKFLKERATKMFHNYKPFEIRMKALKINEHFSLRIINQSKINLIFRYGRNHLKQNMGMSLKCDEIIDTEFIEMDDVSTPYDRQFPKSESIAAIQNVLLKAKRTKH